MFQSIFGYRAKSPIPNINALELQRMITDVQDLIIVDVRSPFEYEHDGHIHGSRLLPLSALMQRVNEIPADRPLFLCVVQGTEARLLVSSCLRLGYANVYKFSRGYDCLETGRIPCGLSINHHYSQNKAGLIDSKIRPAFCDHRRS